MTQEHDATLARLKKLSEQLDTAKKAADTTAKEIARAQDTTETAKKAVRLHQSAPDATKKKQHRAGKKR